MPICPKNICTPSTLVTHPWWCHTLSVAMAVVMATAAKTLEVKAIHRCKSRVNIDTSANANYALRSACKQQLLLHVQLSHTLLHTPCTVLVRCFARWRSVRKTLSSWLGDRMPAGCWQISPSHLPSVETSGTSPVFLSLRHDISSEGVFSHWPAVLSALPPVHTWCTVARWQHRDHCHRSLLWWQDDSVLLCVLQKDAVWRKSLLWCILILPVGFGFVPVPMWLVMKSPSSESVMLNPY